jgi:CubicO group peptidase (beta-lactamase class C family)
LFSGLQFSERLPMFPRHSIAVVARAIVRYALAMATTLCLIADAGAQTVKRPHPVETSTPPVAAEANSYAAAFDTWRAANDPQTAILVVRRGGKTVFVRGHNTDASGPTLIGSMSKAITGACVATLIRDGKLSFTTPMREALAAFFRKHGRPLDRRFEDVTIEELLTHRSGLHSNREGDPLFVMRRGQIAQHLADVASPEALLAPYLAEQTLVSAPGRTYAYSNAGYLALTAVIEERGGQPFEDYCREKLFVPLAIAGAQLNPDWRMLGGYGGWYISGAEYLAFYEIFNPAHPFLGNLVKAWIDEVRGRWGARNEIEWYSLGVRTSAREGRWSVHHTGTLGSTGRDAHGQPIAAIINSLASRDPSGTGIFIAAKPRPGVTDMRAKVFDLHKEIARIAAAEPKTGKVPTKKDLPMSNGPEL